jgi:hypothetical protein
MKAQKKIKNNEINLRSETLSDLQVPDEQAQQVKGGADSTNSDRTLSQPILYTYTVNNTSSSE